MMAHAQDEQGIPKKDIVVLVTYIPGKTPQETRFLMVYNSNWGGFTLPMTKLRQREDWLETWRDAVIRLRAEYLGLVSTDATPIRDFEDMNGFIPGDLRIVNLITNSLSTDELTEYNFKFFLHNAGVATLPPALAGGPWLTPQEIKLSQPITLTAKYILAVMEERGCLPTK